MSTQQEQPSKKRNLLFAVIPTWVVVVIFGIVLLALIIPTFHGMRPVPSKKSEVCNNLRSIVAAGIVYEIDAPHGRQNAEGTHFSSPTKEEDQLVYVGRRFLFLARSQEIPWKVFQNPLNTHCPPKEILPGVRYDQATDEQIAHCDPVIAREWARSFALDWSAPSGSGSHRVCVADRDPDVWGGKGACVVYADGHAGFLKKPQSSTQSRTLRLREDGTLEPVLWALFATDYGVQDNIYGPDESLGETVPGIWTPGGGSATACWVR